MQYHHMMMILVLLLISCSVLFSETILSFFSCHFFFLFFRVPALNRFDSIQFKWWRLWRSVLHWILSDGFYFISSCCYDTTSSIFSFRTMVFCCILIDRYVNVAVVAEYHVTYVPLSECYYAGDYHVVVLLGFFIVVLLNDTTLRTTHCSLAMLLYLLLIIDLSILKLRCWCFLIRYDLICWRPCSLDAIGSKVPTTRDRCVAGNTITVGRAWGYDYNCCWGGP